MLRVQDRPRWIDALVRADSDESWLSAILDVDEAAVLGLLRRNALPDPGLRSARVQDIRNALNSGRLTVECLTAWRTNTLDAVKITEQARLSEAAIVLQTIAELQKLGVRFAFDDLGLAYSHMPLIDKIRPSFLKISQEFGTRFETDPTKTKIVANLLSLAHDFQCDLILEGIEDQRTAEVAADMGIPFGQGFLFGRPADASSFTSDEFTRSRSPTTSP